jgi:hypothetical protein
MSIETRINRLVEKTGIKKSRWTVPLMKKAMMGPVGKNYLEISGTVLELCMTDGPVWRNMIGRR